MTLKPIPGAPIGAPIPDFPAGDPGPLVVPPARFAGRPAEPLPSALPPPVPLPRRRPGPVEICGSGDSILTFRCIPEIPAINRASLIISITGETAGRYPGDMLPPLHLPIDEARMFLLALRDENPPVVATGSRTALQVEFALADDGPVFTVSTPGQQRTLRRFNVGRSFDVKAMAAHLLADLGP